MFCRQLFVSLPFFLAKSKLVKSITNRCSDVFGCFIIIKGEGGGGGGKNEKSRKIHKCPFYTDSDLVFC